MKGKLITVEGIEGAGKSTALQFIQTYLTAAHISVASNDKENIQPETELLLIFAGRAQHIHHFILPALRVGKWVVSDRYIDASYAYQGGGRNIETKYITMLDEWIVNAVYPDLTLLLDITPAMGFQRADKRGKEKDRIEQETIAFFSRVRASYLARAKQASQRIKMIDASLSLVEVETQIRSVLDSFISENIV